MLVPYKQWLLAKQRRRLHGSWDRDMRPSNGTDCMDLCDVVHSPQFKARFADLIGMGTHSPSLPDAASESHRKLGAVAATVEHGAIATPHTEVTPPIRGKAVPCIDVDTSNSGHTPKGED